jgi:endonuclease/exonuclease/phosphatase family metal-dependent hydrolase
MTFNVNWDSIFPPEDPQNHELRAFDRVESFQRILRAVQPDVLCLQEINPLRSPRALASMLQQAAGATDGSPWHAVSVNDDVIASRFNMLEKGYELETGSILASLDQAAALIEFPKESDGEHGLYVICAHLRSGSSAMDRAWRLRQADVIMADIRDLTTPGGRHDLPAGTPLVILGDLNAYATEVARQLPTLIEGDISDEGRYGADFHPDWDGTALTDAFPSHNGQGTAFYTWRNDTEPFPPGALDRIIFSDSSLRLENAFVLDTTLMTDEALAASGLLRNDVLLEPETGNFDHLPVIADFGIEGS